MSSYLHSLLLLTHFPLVNFFISVKFLWLFPILYLMILISETWGTKSLVHYFCWLSFLMVCFFVGCFCCYCCDSDDFGSYIVEPNLGQNGICFPLKEFMFEATRNRGCYQHGTFPDSPEDPASSSEVRWSLFCIPVLILAFATSTILIFVLAHNSWFPLRFQLASVF